MRAAMDTAEIIAKTFCEASGLYKWGDTSGGMRKWYLQGARAVLDLPFVNEPEPPYIPKGPTQSVDYATWRRIYQGL